MTGESSFPKTLRRLGYDPARETRALQALAALDPEACRRELGRLVADLAPDGGADGSARLLTHLLADILQRVNRAINDPQASPDAYLARRFEIIEGYSACATASEARDRFLPALNRLLAPVAGSAAPGSSLVARATGLIDEQFQRRLSLSSVARSLAVSPGHLSRVFRRETGTTLTAYLQRVRITRSRTLLARGDGTLAEVAYRVGYQTYRDFYRNFVRFEGVSPRRARARLRDGRPDRALDLS